MSRPTIFERIIRGEVPSHRIYEDSHVVAFLDVNPLSQGHALVVPKEVAVTLDALSDESAAAIGRILPRLCRAIIQATGCREYNILQNNGPGAHQVVPHVHFHIIPKPSAAQGLGIEWPVRKLDDGAGRALADEIRRRL